MPPWTDITTSEAFQSLPPQFQRELKQAYFEAHIKPLVAADTTLQSIGENGLREWFMAMPNDSGQGYAASLANAAGRGFASVVPGVVGGVGAITDSDLLRDVSDDIEGAINRTLPVNPANEGWGTLIAGGVGQAANVMVTAGVGGAIGKGFAIARGVEETSAIRSAIQLGSEVASMGTGVLSGASEGGDIADERNLEGGDRFAMVVGKGALEYLTEQLPFGQLAETGAVRRILGGSVSEKIPGFIGSTLSEGGEEAASQVGSNFLEQALAKPGQETPGLLDGTLESAVGGMAGGALFGAANALTSSPPSTEAPAALPDVAPAFTALAPTEPVTPVTIAVAGVAFERGEDGQWRKPVTDFAAERDSMDENGRVLLNPDDPIAGAMIPILDAQASKIKEPAPAEETPAPQNAPLTLESIPDEERSVSEAPAPEEPLTLDSIPPKTPAARKERIDSLPAPEGVPDIIEAIQGEGLRLGQVTDGGEWDWYRELSKAAASSGLRKQSAEKAARLGQLEDPAALKAWVDANLLAPDGMMIDDAAGHLANDPRHSFNVDANSIGQAILDAIDARLKARSDGNYDTHIAELEAAENEREAQSEAAFVAHDVTSAAPAITAASLAHVVGEGSTVTIAGREYTVDDADSDLGLVTLSHPNVGTVTLRGPDILRPELIDGAAQIEDSQTSDIETPFSLAQDDDRNRARQLEAQAPEHIAPELTSFTGLALREKAKAFFQAFLLPRTPVVTRDGRSVRFTMSGYRETQQHSADARVLQIVPNLPSLIARAIPLWSEPSTKATKPNIIAFHHYGTKAEIDGKPFYVRILLREDNDGHIYYDNDATTIEQESETTAPQPDRKPNAEEGASRLARSKLHQWLQKVNAERGASEESLSVESVRAGIDVRVGRVGDRVRVINDPLAVNREGKPWKAKVENGTITLNVAHITSIDEAVWNIEHEAAHEVFAAASSDPALARAWNTLQRALSAHPDITTEVQNLDYSAAAVAEESAVRLAQKLDGTAKTAWEAFKEAVWNFLRGAWGEINTPFAHRAAAQAATRIMSAAGGESTSKTDGPRYSLASSGNAQPITELVRTPAGLTAMGSLVKGSEVITNNGATTTVTGTYPQGRKTVYRVTLEDGRSTLATANHLWMVETGAVLMTQDLQGRLVPALSLPA